MGWAEHVNVRLELAEVVLEPLEVLNLGMFRFREREVGVLHLYPIENLYSFFLNN